MRHRTRFPVPSILLVGLLANLAAAAPAPSTRVVEVAAKRFEYSPKEITLRKGEPVTLRFHSEDVVHGVFSRKLGIDADLVPGKPVELTITPGEAGTFTAICNHFCGSGHGGMKLKIVVEPAGE